MFTVVNWAPQLFPTVSSPQPRQIMCQFPCTRLEKCQTQWRLVNNRLLKLDTVFYRFFALKFAFFEICVSTQDLLSIWRNSRRRQMAHLNSSFIRQIKQLSLL